MRTSQGGRHRDPADGWITILKHTCDLSDEAPCERLVRTPITILLRQFFLHQLVLDRSSLTRWRQRMGEEKLQALLQESLAVATRTAAIKPWSTPCCNPRT